MTSISCVSFLPYLSLHSIRNYTQVHRIIMSFLTLKTTFFSLVIWILFLILFLFWAWVIIIFFLYYYLVFGICIRIVGLLLFIHSFFWPIRVEIFVCKSFWIILWKISTWIIIYPYYTKSLYILSINLVVVVISCWSLPIESSKLMFIISKSLLLLLLWYHWRHSTTIDIHQLLISVLLLTCAASFFIVFKLWSIIVGFSCRFRFTVLWSNELLILLLCISI